MAAHPDMLTGLLAIQHPHPEFNLGSAHTRFEDALQLTDTKTQTFLTERLEDFCRFAPRFKE